MPPDLKDFQSATVEHVLRRLYTDTDATDRFLVADEVGMGKTLVAAGVIDGAIKRLQDDDSIDRIDVVYICSNQAIAAQNIGKLNVKGDTTTPLSTRISMLASQISNLNAPTVDGSKRVNLVAFTPGTSFSKGHGRGVTLERALLWCMLEPLIEAGWQRERLRQILQMGVQDRNWEYCLWQLQGEGRELDATITGDFQSAFQRSPLSSELYMLIAELKGSSKSNLKPDALGRQAILISELRKLLSEVSVDALEPDLVILDEFQRFKDLLQVPRDDSEDSVSRLAHQLFNHPDAKLLLLSATPYKLFTLPEESDLTGDDHFKDFTATLEFLGEPRLPEVSPEVRRALGDYRAQIIGGGDPLGPKRTIENSLRKLMCRTERPIGGEADMLCAREDQVGAPTADDLVGFTALKRISKTVDGPLSVEYWKSAPYFLNFMDGYKLSERFHDHLQLNPQDNELLRGAQYFTKSDLDQNKQLDFGNARLRSLADEMIRSGIWKLLWLPPSMQYHEPGGPYCEVEGSAAESITKRLIFSSWAAAPSAISFLLSEAVQREISQGQPMPAGRMNYGLSHDGLPSQMTALALFVPLPQLAKQCDPRAMAREALPGIQSGEDVILRAATRIESSIPPPGEASSELSQDTWYWATPFILGGAPLADDLSLWITDNPDAGEPSGLAAHLARAGRASEGDEPLGAQPADLAKWVAAIGLASPANITLRSLYAALGEQSDLSEETILHAATIIATGFHSLFNRGYATKLVDIHGSGGKYWQSVLEYCHGGNLQAVMDEYLHHLIGNESPKTDEDLIELARQVRSSVALGPGPVHAFDPESPEEPITTNPRFALRFGNAKGRQVNTEQAAARAQDVQAAFNSPFWPMVLASTSVGQEGIDFHWWCHAIIHWNLPANPTDFEQREGRIHRFKGHAVRKNVAARHGRTALASGTPDPWMAAFELAQKDRPNAMNDLWPWWVYPGDSKIERWIAAFPLSKDRAKDARLRRQRALYRLAFGQPRQEDLVEMLDRRGGGSGVGDEFCLDLRPNRNTA